MNNVFMSFFHIFLNINWEQKNIFFIYTFLRFLSVENWIAILLFQIIIIVDMQLLIRLTAMRVLNNDRTFNFGLTQ